MTTNDQDPDGSQNPSECDFCAELDAIGTSLFERYYAQSIRSRVVGRRNGLVAVPTMGQILPGSLLVLPRLHVETLSRLPRQEMDDLVPFVDKLSGIVADGRSVIVFEHGATASSGGGCGIYHAHLHVVPVPSVDGIDSILPAFDSESPTLVDAMSTIGNSDEYLLLGTPSAVRVLDLSSRAHEFPSQYFRRAIVEFFALPTPWDWRQFEQPEQDLLDTLERFGLRSSGAVPDLADGLRR